MIFALATCAAPKAPAPPPAALPAPTHLVTGPVSEALPLPAPSQPFEHRGAAPAPPPAAGAAPPVAVTPGGDVTLNFTDADIREVVRAVVGDMLGLNYTIDAKVQGTVTVQTMKPLPRAAVLATLGRVLRANGAALTEEGGMIRVTPLDAAAKGVAAKGASSLGYGVRILPLQYVAAAELSKVLDPFVPAGAVLQVDSAHNVLVLSGTREDMDAIGELARSFDADWLSRMSFALVPLRAATAETIIAEMQAIIAGASGGAEGAASALRLLPVERLNAVLVISAQPRYLDWARQQIAILDAGSEDGAEHTYIYHVQFGRAADLADVLGRVFGATGAAPAAKPASTTSSYLQPSSFSTGSMAAGATAGATTGGATAGGAAAGGAAPSGGLAGGAPSGGLAAAAPLANVLGQTQGATASPSPATPSSATPGAAAPQTAPGRVPINIVTDERNNAIVIVTTPHEYRRVEEALHRLDVKPLQVVIEATIAEVTLNDELQYGLQWFFRSGKGTTGFSNAVTALPFGAPAQAAAGFSYIFTDSNLQVVLNALSSITKVNVISSPQLMVLNNQTAQLQVGQQVPVPVEQQQSTLTPGAPLVNTINYLNTGVILSVTPRANATGEVTLDIEQEVSDVATTTTAGLNAPTIDERRVKSTVSVQSGESIALGGLIRNSVTKARSAIPLLGEIPVIGALFRNDDNTTVRDELLVLIEPRIIAGTDDARAATEELKRRMQDVRPILAGPL